MTAVQEAIADGTSVIPCKTICRAVRRGQDPAEYHRAEVKRALNPHRPTTYDTQVAFYFKFLQ